MTLAPPGPLFDVMSRDVHGSLVRCSYCARVVDRVVVLPITPRPELEGRIADSDGVELWLGLCARCVDGMRLALAVGAKMEDAS